jgi:hypothetical protein
MREKLEQMRDEAAAKFSETMDQAMNQLITSVIHAMTAMRAATEAAQRPDP